ncbi:MAG: O-antigen ligase family protein [Acidobacteriia bacterium]|nr:O-antigen ligase family protein [Terriglobia bacterium]
MPRRRGFIADQGLWLIVAAFLLCTALGIGLNTKLYVGDNLSSARAASANAQEGGRIFNEAAIAVCLIGLLMAASRTESFRRSFRVWKNPVVWALAYQAIMAWHYWSNDNAWDMARLCGVWLLLMVAMASSAPMTLDRYVPKMLLLFRLLLWISLIVGIVLPDNAWMHDYISSFIPGLNDRFAGIAGHPNSMGAVVGIAVLMELDQFFGDGSKRWLSLVHLLLGSALLLLTQSKMALLACAACAVWFLLSRRNRLLRGPVRVVVVATTVVAGALVAWASLADWVASNQYNLDDLTGRIGVWQYLWDVARERPWFGYGDALWSQLYLSESFQYKWAAGNAHNQLLNSFLMTGLVGVGCLVAFVTALFRQRRRIDPNYRALFTACLAFLLIRSIAEAGFEPGSLGVAGLLQTVLIGFCFCLRKPERAALPGCAARPGLTQMAGTQERAFRAAEYRMRRRLLAFPRRNPIPGKSL